MSKNCPVNNENIGRGGMRYRGSTRLPAEWPRRGERSDARSEEPGINNEKYNINEEKNTRIITP